MSEKDQPTPEQLLKMLDLQLEASRQARTNRKGSGNGMRVLSIAIILIATMAALWVLMTMLEEMRLERPPREVPAQTP
jgi:hypothetical protein